MKVYVVTRGHYSDMSVQAVFSSEEKAKAYIAVYAKADNSFVEYDYELDDPDGEWTKHRGMHPYFVRMMGDKVWADRLGDDPDECIRPYDGRDRTDLCTECWARDEEHAIKIAVDRRAAFRARLPPAREPGIEGADTPGYTPTRAK